LSNLLKSDVSEKLKSRYLRISSGIKRLYDLISRPHIVLNHDYRIPRALDMPEIETILVEEVEETSPAHEGLPYGGLGIMPRCCNAPP